MVFERAADAQDLAPLEHAEEADQSESPSRKHEMAMEDIDAEGGEFDDPGSDRVRHLHVDHDDQHREGRDDVDESGPTMEGRNERILGEHERELVWSEIKRQTEVERVVDAD